MSFQIGDRVRLRVKITKPGDINQNINYIRKGAAGTVTQNTQPNKPNHSYIVFDSDCFDSRHPSFCEISNQYQCEDEWLEKVKESLKVGDLVEVLNWGNTWSMCEAYAKELGLTSYAYGDTEYFDKGTKGIRARIVSVGEDKLGIQPIDSTKQYIIGKASVKKLVEENQSAWYLNPPDHYFTPRRWSKSYRFDTSPWFSYDLGESIIKKPIKPKKSLMSSISLIAKKLLDPSLKTLIDAGFMSSDLTLTEDGRYALEATLFAANKDELVKAAEEKIAEKNKK